MKILLRGPNWVGDAILAIPAMKAVREALPAAEITLLARPWVAGVFVGAPFIDHVWIAPKNGGLSALARLGREIREARYDAAILFPNSFESALTIFLGRVPRRVGYAGDGRTWLLTTALDRPRPAPHQTDYYLALARALAPFGDPPSIGIEATPQEKNRARAVLEAEGIEPGAPFIALSPGAAFGSAKRWDADRFARTGEILAAESGCAVAIVGSESERVMGNEVAKRIAGPVADLTGKTTLEELVGVIAQATLVVANDSGVMHIAAALGTPTVAVFGPTDSTVTGPRGARVRIVRHPVECSPCMLRDCPIDRRCMTRVTVEDVCRAGREIMAIHA
ncbi:MAG TPA: lipopolysaccharide heptosyltransferase II [Terriglobia bacterium]|nr:lipopolysaccharide heptosyltransferase II [Terriglobia bacterium]